jgi:hypothetical protein
MKKITPTARRERPFPVPIDENARRCRDDEQDKNEKRALQITNLKPDVARFQLERWAL